MPTAKSETKKVLVEDKQKKTVVILDAHAIIHRAYHALPSFVNSRGEPTGALYGIVTMLLRIIDEFNPDAVVAAFDLPRPTFRHHAYGEYKAGRAKTDDELVAQLQSARTLFEMFSIPCLDATGFEADDIIGTLVKTTLPKSWKIIIASGDMDTLQLVEDDRVMVYTLKKGITDTILYNEKAVQDRYGFLPKQLIDYKGLRGDPSDNIIGIAGIGEKTATTLITVFGTIEQMYVALKKNDTRFAQNKITERICTLLREHEDDALFSKMLATIRTDAPVSFTLPGVHFKETLDEKKVLEYLYDMEFKSLITRVKKLFSPKEQNEDTVVVQSINPAMLQKSAVALWVLKSDFTIADEGTILAETRTSSIEDALVELERTLKKEGLWDLYEKIELPLIPIMQAMREYGVMVDRSALTTLGESFKEKIATLEKDARAIVGREINLASPKQLSQLLFEELHLIPKGKRKVSGSYTTNAEVLETMKGAHPIVDIILKHREVQKLQTTYVEPLLSYCDAHNRIHADFYQNGTTTGRFSSAHPNLQNIPIDGEYAKEIRRAFIAGEGSVFVGADYSQIELRVLAMLSGDEQLIRTFQEGKDIHATVAASVFGVQEHEVSASQRRAAKVINFGIIYGMGVTALQKNLGTTREEAALFYDNYFRNFPRVTSYLENSKKDAARVGYTTTFFGRRRYFAGMKSPLPHIRAFAERMASNAPIQGTAADLIKIAIILIDEDLRCAGLLEKAHFVLQIHDEIIYEVAREYAQQVREIITQAMKNAIERSPIGEGVSVVPLEVASAVGERLDELK